MKGWVDLLVNTPQPGIEPTGTPKRLRHQAMRHFDRTFLLDRSVIFSRQSAIQVRCSTWLTAGLAGGGMTWGRAGVSKKRGKGRPKAKRVKRGREREWVKSQTWLQLLSVGATVWVRHCFVCRPSFVIIVNYQRSPAGRCVLYVCCSARGYQLGTTLHALWIPYWRSLYVYLSITNQVS